MLTTVPDPKLLIPKRSRQYVVSVDPMDPTALGIAYDLWAGLPGTTRVVARGMLYLSSLKPLHVDMFSPIVLDETRPVKSVYVGPPPMPDVVVDEEGKRTIFPPPKDLIVVGRAQEALELLTKERVALNEDTRAEELKQKLLYYGAVAACFMLAALGLWAVCR